MQSMRLFRAGRVCKNLTLAAIVSLSLCGLGSRAHADNQCEGVKLPETTKAFGVDLKLNGMGVRRVTVFGIKVYVAGLYLERKTRSPAIVLQRNQTKLVTMVFMRDADRAKMVEVIRENVERQPTGNRDALVRSLRQLEKLLPETPKKGGRLSLAYSQSQGLEVRHNGQLSGVLKDEALAESLFRTWVGEEPADSDLKAGLLGGECS